MPVKGATFLVPGDTDGMYTPPTGRSIDRISAIMRAKLPRHVDHNGRTIKGPDPAVTEMANSTPIRPMAEALAEIAATLDVDLSVVVANPAFRAEIATISPSDTDALTDAVRFHSTPAPAAPSMKVNPSQGHVAGPVLSPGSGTLAEQMRKNTDKLLSQPEPPGSTYR